MSTLIRMLQDYTFSLQTHICIAVPLRHADRQLRSVACLAIWTRLQSLWISPSRQRPNSSSWRAPNSRRGSTLQSTRQKLQAHHCFVLEVIASHALKSHWTLIEWLIDWLIDGLIDWLTDWLIEWLIHWLVDWLIDWLIDLLIDWFIDWLIDRLIDWLIDWLID